MNKVLVIMSTYNGGKYIREQIDSILSQKQVYVSLLIRDDGSSDNTTSIINEYIEKGCPVRLIEGKNVGWRASFSKVIESAGSSDFYALADQDDFWYEDKLIAGINMISDIKGPVLYRGRSYIADGDLNNTNQVFQDIPVLSPKKSLFQNFCQGCTLIFNQDLLDLYKLHPIESVSHDIWIPIIANFTGVIVDDKTPHMLYRVHQSNATAGMNIAKTWKKRYNGWISKTPNSYNYNYGMILFRYYSSYINEEKIRICEEVSNLNKFKNRILLFMDKEVSGNSLLRTIFVKYLVLMDGFKT